MKTCLLPALTLSAVAMLSLMTACNRQGNESPTPSAPQPGSSLPSGDVRVGRLFGQPIKYLQTASGLRLFQGDITLTEAQLRDSTGTQHRGAGTGRTAARWPNNTVYFIIDPALPNQQRVWDAIADWQNNSPVRFVQGTGTGSYIRFVKNTTDNNCYSSVGQVGGEQLLRLSDNCTAGNTIHEIGHATGLWHEQSRTDRDNAITVQYGNIQDGFAYAFDTYAAQGSDGFNFGPFDFSSIMLYDPYSFSKNGQPTITRRDGSVYTAQRTRLSAGDLSIAHYMYPDGIGGERAFDVATYRSIHSDLAGFDDAAARNHWLTYGINEGRSPSSAFDPNFYKAVNSDLSGFTSRDALNHWLTYGIFEGRRSAPAFDPRYYLDYNTDLRNLFGADGYQRGLYHYLRYGINEGRKASADFDPKAYLNRYADLRSAFGATNYRQALYHWLQYGRAEGRQGN